jgi:hypothetical protein
VPDVAILIEVIAKGFNYDEKWYTRKVWVSKTLYKSEMMKASNNQKIRIHTIKKKKSDSHVCFSPPCKSIVRNNALALNLPTQETHRELRGEIQCKQFGSSQRTRERILGHCDTQRSG